MNTSDNVFPGVNGGRARIWLVDDSNSLRHLIAEFLNNEGDFECTGQFGSAEAVLAALERETPPDVILLDVNMGGMSGLEAIRPIKAIATSTRVLILTTVSDWESKTQALRDGASDFLLKSSPLTIPDHIRLALSRPAQNPGESERPAIESFKFLSSDRRAPELNGRSSDRGALSPPEGYRKRSEQCTSSRLARGVHYLRALFGWGRRRAKVQDEMTVLQQ